MNSELISYGFQKNESRVNRINKNVNFYYEFNANKNYSILKSTINDDNSQIIEFILSQNDIKNVLKEE